jgi:hypothetical protein
VYGRVDGGVVIDTADEVGVHVHGVEHGVGWFRDGVCRWCCCGVCVGDVVCAVGELVDIDDCCL